MKRNLLLLQVLMLLVAVFVPQAAWAQIDYIDADEDGTLSTAMVENVVKNSTDATWGRVGQTNYYYYDQSVTISGRVVIEGTVYLILNDSIQLTCEQGIHVGGTNKIVFTSGAPSGTEIKGEGTVFSPCNIDYVANIGGDEKEKCGTIVINSGVIKAIGDEFDNISRGNNTSGASIGSGYQGSDGTIIINGGSVYAKNGAEYVAASHAAAIGKGEEAGGTMNIIIRGGYVDAESSRYGDLTGDCCGAGIGAGARSTDTCNITISGGTIDAWCAYAATAYGAGIGGGDKAAGYININISGGTINAFSSHYKTGYGAGIGTGNKSTEVLSLNISGGTITSAANYWSGKTSNNNGDGCGAGIGLGSGTKSKGNKITISDAVIDAVASKTDKGYAAGIGAGEDCVGDLEINISGGEIKAVSSYSYIAYGAGIGAGDDCEEMSVNVKISGGRITAYAGETYNGYYNMDAAGIGCGEDGGCDSIIITGGYVTALSSAIGRTDMNAAGIGSGESGNNCKYIGITGDDTKVVAFGETALHADKVDVAVKDAANYVAYAEFGSQPGTCDDTEKGKTLDLTDLGRDYQYVYIYFSRGSDSNLKQVYYIESDGSIHSTMAQQLMYSGTIKGDYYTEDSHTIAQTLTVDGAARIILLDGSKLTAQGCIVVEGSNELTITSGNTSLNIAGTGELTVVDDLNGGGTDERENEGDDARIGSREGNNCGYITINGGKVTTYSSWDDNDEDEGDEVRGADIGSGYKGDQGCITINGGEVNCLGTTKTMSKMYAASIGSGYKAKTATIWIRINGGTVNATGSRFSSYGAAIGTGAYATGRADIVIKDGTITATSSKNSFGYGAGIGTGDEYEATGNTTIEIRGGNITACSSADPTERHVISAAGIGMGDNWSSSYGKVDVTITGGTVLAYSSGNTKSYGSGIGGGDDGGCGDIIISGNAKVTAASQLNHETRVDALNGNTGAGIGDGDANKTGSLTIYGDQCTVDTWGLYGIGYGSDGGFTAKVYPMDGVAKVESGDSAYAVNNSNSPQYYASSQSINYGASKWRRITFENTATKDVYYTDENGDVAGPVTAHVCNSVLPLTFGNDSSATVYYYADTIITASMGRSKTKGNVVLIMGDNAVITAPKGIGVEDDNTFTITTGGVTKDYAGTGSLTATASTGSMDAAIGCSGVYDDNNPYPNSCGNIIINAGTVNATAYYYGAGIGGGKNAAQGGSITINGGTVTANASPGDVYHGYGAGIGGGSNRTNPDITINGGTIKAYSTSDSQGWGAGIGAGNGAAAGDIRINGGTIVATSAENGTNWGAGIGGGYDEGGDSILVGGMVMIYGDETDVTATGAKSLVATTMIAAGGNADAVVDYGASSSDYSTYTEQTVNMSNMTGNSVSSYAYAHIYFNQRYFNVYYTQEDGSVSENTVKAIDCAARVPKTLGDGTETPVYYFLYGNPEQDLRSVVSGNAVLILADDCDASVTDGITVEEGNTLTITTGDTTRVYDGMGAIDVGSNDTNNAAIGSTQPDYNNSESSGHTAGTINIYDGTIVAHVVAEGNSDEAYAAAIGGGAGNGNAGIINITGGNVTAYCAYSGTGKGAGIGGGNGEWFGRRDGGMGGNITISGTAQVEAYSSYKGSNLAAGIGRGCEADLLSGYTGTVTIKGDSTVVIAKGACAIYGTAATAIPDYLAAKVDYGDSEESYSTYTSANNNVDLLDFNGADLRGVNYAKVYFGFANYLYYTQEDGSVCSERVLSFKTTLPETLGDGTETPVYYYLSGEPEYNYRMVVNGNAVIVLGDSCEANLTAGITVEEGNTLTITTGGLDSTYIGTGAIDVLSDDTNNAAIGSTQPDGESSDYAGHTAGTINIYDGNVVAHVVAEGNTDETYAAAIGGGAGNGNAGIINITGGTVKAYSAYSGTGNGAGIGGGNGEWYNRKDGGMGGTVTISGTAHVEAYCSVTGKVAAAGIGYGRYANKLSDYTGTITIKGDSAVVIAKGECAMYATAAAAMPNKAITMVDYGESEENFNTYQYEGEVNLLYFNRTSLSEEEYGKVYFYPFYSQNKFDVYYTQADGSVSDTTVKAYDCSTLLPATLGDGTETPVYYYLYGEMKLRYNRPVVNGNAVIILSDDCNASITVGITVEEGNTLTITTGDTTRVYDGTGALDVGTNDTENAAIGSTKPDGRSSVYPGHTAGTINIYDGTIVAHVLPIDDENEKYWSADAAAIGGGSNGNAGIINITGGNVTAYCAYAGLGNGAGIGGGFRNWDGGMGGDVTISGNAHVEAYSSYKGSCTGAGIGVGNNMSDLSAYTGTVTIKGDSAVVIAKGYLAIYGTAATAIPDNLEAIVDYGDSEEGHYTYASANNVNLYNFNGTSLGLARYAKVYFGKTNHLYYTQKDGARKPAFAFKTALPDTLGNGSTYPVYYYLTGETEYNDRLVVNGNAVIVLGDSCKANLTAGITVEEGNTLTITTGGLDISYTGTGAIEVLSNDANNAAIGSTQPSGSSSDYAGYTAGTINIYDGNVVAHVAEEGSDTETYAAAIGGGAGNGNAGTINITGGSVKAYSAYSGTGNGAGIGGGNGEWFGRKDGGFGGTVTISGDAHVEAYSSVTGTATAAGIGFGRYANELSDYTGTVTIKGDSAVVIAKGACAIYGTAATATPVEMLTMVDYGESADSYDTYRYAGEVNLLDFNSTSLSTVKYGKVYFAEPEAITLAEALDSVENVTYTISDDLFIVETTNVDGILWCTDGNGNWVKVASDDYETLKSAGLLQGGTIQGQMSDLDTNPVLTLSKTPSTLNGDKYNNIANYNVAKSFSEAQPDEIATFTGYYFVENGTPKFRGFGGSNPNHKGQSLVLDLTKYVTGVSMTEGNLYTLRCAVQINEAWEEEESSNAPRRVSKSDGDTYFTNYTAYALEDPQEVTGITENMLNKEIDHIDYVNTIGQVSDTPWEGVNIVVTTYTDGSTSTAKVVK